MRRTALRRRTPLRRVSARRFRSLTLYWRRREAFLRRHPYCQAWLASHGIGEDSAIRRRGLVLFQGRLVAVPRSQTIHHLAKRRGARLLDENAWMAVSLRLHRLIETRKAWARAQGFLRNF